MGEPKPSKPDTLKQLYNGQTLAAELAAKINAINATLMEKNALKIAKMLKMGLE